MGRQRKRVAFIGSTGTGKSTQVKKMIEHRCEKYKEKAIILDPNRQAAWSKYAAIDMGIIKGMQRGIYKVNTMEYRKFFETIFTDLKPGSQVVSEDSSNWAGPHEDKKITAVLVSLRHPDHDADLTFIFHVVYRVPDYIFEQLHEVILFKTGENWDSFKHMIPEEKLEMFKEAFERVRDHPSLYYFERIILKKTSDQETKQLKTTSNG